MAEPIARIVSINELRFHPANSNDRARAGMEHAFTDVPRCSFAKDDGISPYLGSDAGIKDFPDTPASQSAMHGDVPAVVHEGGQPALTIGQKLLRSGFALSVLVHAVAFAGVSYFALALPSDEALLAGETVISLEFFSESEINSTLAGDIEATEAPAEQPVEEVKERPVEKPVEPVKPVATSQEPEVLATDQPSTFAVEQAARTILETTDIAPLAPTLPEELIVPPEVREEAKEEPKPSEPATPIEKPVEKPVEVEKKLDVKPVEKEPEPKPVEKKSEPKPVEKKVEAKTPEKPVEKKVVDKVKKTKGDAGKDESRSDRGSKNSRNQGKQSQDASQGGQKNREAGNADLSNYNGLIQRKLERAKKRVRLAGKGKVVVGFTLHANGSVSNVRLKSSSGKPAVDKGAMDVVRKAAPFPPFPTSDSRPSRMMSVPMTFK
jgi:protein TonB